MKDDNDPESIQQYQRGYVPRMFVSLSDKTKNRIENRNRPKKANKNTNEDRITKYTGGLLIATGVIALASVFSLITTIFQWSILKGQLQVMQSDKRPWLSVSAVPETGFINLGDWISMSVVFHLKNYGQSPAVNVQVSPKIVFWDIGTEARDPRIEMDTTCGQLVSERQNWAERPQGRFGDISFPGEDIIEETAISISKKDIEKALRESNNNTLKPILIVCAIYKATGDDYLYQTGALFSIKHESKNSGEGFVDFNGDISEISANKLEFEKFYLNGGYLK